MNAEKDWYYAVDGASQGPINQRDFDALVGNGTIRPDTLVWQEGMDDWLPLGQMPGAKVPIMPPRAPSLGGQSPARDDASTFIGALKDGFSRYVDFSTRSNRPQFWYWFLWSLILGFVTGSIDGILGTGMEGMGLINSLFSLVIFLPSLAVAIRRLHDIGRTGWWYLLIFVPILGWIVLIVFYCTKGEEHPNKWGNPT